MTMTHDARTTGARGATGGGPTAPRAKREFRFTGWHMLAIMIAFYAVIITVNVTLAVLASGSWTGLVVKNSYVASQGYNEHLAAARAQVERGWHSEIAVAPGRIAISVLSSDGTPLALEAATVEIGRPATEVEDRTLDLEPAGGGIYAADANLAEGLWALTVTATSDGVPYRREARVSVGADGIGRIVP